MTSVIDFYFDFISPYSYLAHKKLKYLNQNNKLNMSSEGQISSSSGAAPQEKKT